MSMLRLIGIRPLAGCYEHIRKCLKEGLLTINVDPKIEVKKKIIEVHNEDDLKPDEVIIEAKVIEEK